MRALRRLSRYVAIAVLSLVILLGAGVAVTQTSWFKNWLRQKAVSQAAQYLNDVVTFEAASERISEMCTRVDSAAFATRLSALLNLSLGAGFEPVRATTGALIRKRVSPDTLFSKVRTELELCQGSQERAERALGMVLQHANARQGYLYLMQPEGPALATTKPHARND